ncbi:MAG: TonB-dependent siderophore receptor [Bryobacteraceae bacterium]
MSVKRIKIRTKSKKAVANRWLATGTLAAYMTLGSAEPAKAQQAPAGGTAASQSNTLPVVQLQIPKGPLSEVAKAFESATGRRVIFENGQLHDQILDIGSQGISGPLTLEAAIRQMLMDTGVSYRLDGNNVLLEVRSAFRVEVTDAVPQVTSPRYTATLRDIPQSISVISRAVIDQQGATTLAQVLRNVPGITMTAGEGGAAAGDNLTLRGNSARNDIFIDGSRDLSSQSRDPFNMEQVEITKGPTSSISGRGSAGGTVNLVSKAPSSMRGMGGSFAFGNASQRRSTFDINTPAPFLGERTGFRLNLLWHESGVPGRQVVQNDRWGFAPALTFGMGTRNRLTLQHYKLKQDNTSDYGIPWVPATNTVLPGDTIAPVTRDTFYGFKDRDREFLNQDSSTIKYEHDFSDGLTFRNQLRYGRAGRNSIATPPRFNAATTTVINREMRAWVAQDRIWDNQSDLRFNLRTGPISHAMNAGAALTRETNIRRTRTAPNSLTTLLNPNPNDVYTGAFVENPIVGNIVGNTQAAWINDTASMVGGKLQASGGVRFERFDVNGVSTTPAPVLQTVKFASLRGGLTYKPVQSGSIYASYGSSISPSLDGLSYTTSNTAIPPEKTYTTEAGAKWDLIGGRVLATGAVFRVAKDNARTPGLLPTDPPQVLAGQQVSKGVEMSLTGAITRSLRVLGAYTLIDAKIGKSNTPAEVGKFFQNTPRHSASLWATYTKQRFNVGIGPRFMSKRYGNNTNTRVVDGFWTMDAMIGVTANSKLSFQLNLTNLNNAYYFDRLGGGHIIPAASRGVLMTTNFHF